MSPAIERPFRTTIDRRAALRAGAGLVAFGAVRHRGGNVMAQDATPTAVPDVPDDFKVVLHAAEAQDWIYVLSNLDNLTQSWPKSQLRLVVDGSAVYPLASDNDLSSHLGELATKGVDVFVCPNALREHQIDVGTMPSYARTDIGGVVALVQAQNQGYRYVKP